MTITEQLEQAGVSLDDNVGYLYKSRDEAGIWRIEDAKVARVCHDLPAGTQNLEKAQRFDPKDSVYLLGESEGVIMLHIVYIGTSIKIKSLKSCGLRMETATERVYIGQADNFMKEIYTVLRALQNVRKKKVLH
jgi:hypothetical protein